MANKNKEILGQPIWGNNPVVVQILGICSALAVTAQLKPAIVMGLSVTVIVALSNVVISLLSISKLHSHSMLEVQRKFSFVRIVIFAVRIY